MSHGKENKTLEWVYTSAVLISGFHSTGCGLIPGHKTFATAPQGNNIIGEKGYELYNFICYLWHNLQEFVLLACGEQLHFVIVSSYKLWEVGGYTITKNKKNCHAGLLSTTPQSLWQHARVHGAKKTGKSRYGNTCLVKAAIFLLHAKITEHSFYLSNCGFLKL